MLYNSTQNAAEVVSAAQAIAQGISKDGGLFVPQEFPKYSAETFNELLKLDYKGRAKKVFADFLSAVSDLYRSSASAYSSLGKIPLNPAL